MRNTYLYGFATFGHPNDYRQSPFVLDNKEIAKNVKIFDLPNAIKVFPSSTLYSIRKENIGGFACVSYAIYTFANEMTSMRDGTFIGSSILYTNEIAEENITVSKLNEFHKLLVEKNTQNDILTVKHSNDFELPTQFINDFEKIVFHLKPIEDLENFTSSNRHLIVGSWTEENYLTTNFKKALHLLNKYDTIFFTSSKDIWSYCQNRNIYSTTDENGFNQKIANIQFEKQKRVLNSISEFDQEKQKLQTDKENVLIEIRNQLDRLKNTHSENERIIKESESKNNNINSYYNEFLRKLDDYSNQLKSGRKLEDVRKLYNENKRIFIDSVSNSKPPQFINKLNKISATSNLKQDNTRPQYNQNFIQSSQFHNEETINKHRSRKFSIYKILTAVFCLLWLGTIVYFLIFYEQNERVVSPISEQVYPQQQNIPQPNEIKQLELNPNPNSKLNASALKLINKEGVKNKTPKQIVDIVFEKNPTDIASHYDNQKELYQKVLISKNLNCFQNNICICDSLLYIPSFRK